MEKIKELINELHTKEKEVTKLKDEIENIKDEIIKIKVPVFESISKEEPSATCDGDAKKGYTIRIDHNYRTWKFCWPAKKIASVACDMPLVFVDYVWLNHIIDLLKW